jgi:hypothetical protein
MTFQVSVLHSLFVELHGLSPRANYTDRATVLYLLICQILSFKDQTFISISSNCHNTYTLL